MPLSPPEKCLLSVRSHYGFDNHFAADAQELIARGAKLIDIRDADDIFVNIFLKQIWLHYPCSNSRSSA